MTKLFDYLEANNEMVKAAPAETNGGTEKPAKAKSTKKSSSAKAKKPADDKAADDQAEETK